MLNNPGALDAGGRPYPVPYASGQQSQATSAFPLAGLPGGMPGNMTGARPGIPNTFAQQQGVNQRTFANMNAAAGLQSNLLQQAAYLQAQTQAQAQRQNIAAAQGFPNGMGGNPGIRANPPNIQLGLNPQQLAGVRGPGPTQYDRMPGGGLTVGMGTAGLPNPPQVWAQPNQNTALAAAALGQRAAALNLQNQQAQQAMAQSRVQQAAGQVQHAMMQQAQANQGYQSGTDLMALLGQQKRQVAGPAGAFNTGQMGGMQGAGGFPGPQTPQQGQPGVLGGQANAMMQNLARAQSDAAAMAQVAQQKMQLQQNAAAAQQQGKLQAAAQAAAAAAPQGQQTQDHTPFGESDFPTLPTASNMQRPAGMQQQQQGGLAQHDLRGQQQQLQPDYSQIGAKRVAGAGAGQNGEFQIQTEDFPALPGAGQQRPGPQQDDRAVFQPQAGSQVQQPVQRFGQTPQVHGIIGRPGASPVASAAPLPSEQHSGPDLSRGSAFMDMASGVTGSYPPEQLLRMQQQQQAAAAGHMPAGLKGPAGQVGAGALQNTGAMALLKADNYGLLGLLDVIKMTDPDRTMLALGTDLTSLGLNLNSPDTLFKSFVSPLSDQPIRAEPEYIVPACYKHNPPRLQAGFLSKFKEETLFYIFYSMPQDEAQLIAADELATRGWWYHKGMKCWMTRVTGPVAKTQRGERGSYLIFDTNIWDAVQKTDFEIFYDEIERLTPLNRPPKLAAARA